MASTADDQADPANLTNPFSPAPPPSTNAGGWQTNQNITNLPPGWTRNPDGSISVTGGGQNGGQVGAAPPGFTLDSNTGVLTPIPGSGQPTPPPNTQQPPTAPSGGLFNPTLYTPFTGTPPTYQAPTLPNAPIWNTPPKFSYADFVAPSLDEASKQPGYQFGLQQGEQALQQSMAAQGLLRTGGTLKDILNYGQQAGTQNYSNVLNQDLGIYNTNRAGAVQAYNTNYQTQYVDPYQAQVLPYQTQAANAQHVSDAQYNAANNAFNESADIFYANQSNPFSKYLSLAQLGAANA